MSLRRAARLRRFVATAVAAAALSIATVASAERRAHPRERAAVIAAAVAGHDINKAQAPCVRVSISTVNDEWASVDFVYPTPRACHEPANGISLYHHRLGHWHFVLAGSSFGCNLRRVPKRVAADLLRRYRPQCG